MTTCDAGLLQISLLAGLLASTCLAFTGPAAAQSQTRTPAQMPRPRGIYIGSAAGSNFLPGETVADPGWAHLPPGFALNETLGYAIGNGLRVETELNFRQNELTRVTINGIGAGARGNQKTFGFMLNVLYDVPLPWFSPYFGFGGGIQASGWFDTHFTVPPRTRLTINDPLGGYAFQGIGGFSIPLPGYPRLSVTADYHFTDVTGKRGYKGSSDNGSGPVPIKVSVGNNLNHTILLGLRYQFGRVGR